MSIKGIIAGTVIASVAFTTPAYAGEKLPYYSTCTEAKAAGHVNIHVLPDNPHLAHLDRDNDNVACEA